MVGVVLKGNLVYDPSEASLTTHPILKGGIAVQAVPDKRAAIIDTAKTLFASSGFHAATTDQIARQAGIAVGTIYNHFSNKEDILSAIFREARDQRIQWWSELDAGLPLRDCVMMFARRHFMSIAADPRLGIILTHQGMLRPAGLAEFQRDIAAAIGRRIESASRGGTGVPGEAPRTTPGPACDPGIVTIMLMGVLEAIVREGVGMPGQRDREEFFERALSQISCAIGPMLGGD